MNPKILIIKHGAFGDFIQCLGAFKALREKHSDAEITLLTTKPFEKLALMTGYFDTVWVDERGGLKKVLGLRQKILKTGFSFVYDLQNSDRTDWYFWMLFPRQPRWCGRVWGCSHRHNTPHRGTMHTLDRIAEQMALVGLHDIPSPTLDWMPHSQKNFDLPEKYALLVAGGAPHRPEKRWSVEGYTALAKHLLEQGILPVLLGTSADATQTDAIAALEPHVKNLTNQTDFVDIASLAKGAVVAVGNDTGPMHVIAIAGCKSIVLYGNASDPKRCGQRGKDVTIIRVEDLAGLPVETIILSLGSV
jgi:ADP-heptose:LPS heptosyltransferase